MHTTNTTLRILSAFLMTGSILWGYWWLTWTLAILFLFIFNFYYEIILWGMVYDALYGLSIPQFYNFPAIFSLSSLILFVIAFYIKKSLSTYEDIY